jgi:hypothetical protein
LFFSFKSNIEKRIKTDHQKSISFNSLSKHEKLNLIFIGLKYGKRSFISMNFKKYFKNRNRFDLYKIFDCLQKNPNKLERFKTKVKSMKDLKVLNNQEESSNYQELEITTRSSEEENDDDENILIIPEEIDSTKITKTNNSFLNSYIKQKSASQKKNSWTNDEILNLVYLVNKFRSKLNWKMILKDYNQFFHERKVSQLRNKYSRLKKHKTKYFDFIKKQVESMKELIVLKPREEENTTLKISNEIEKEWKLMKKSDPSNHSDSILSRLKNEEENVRISSGEQIKEENISFSCADIDSTNNLNKRFKKTKAMFSDFVNKVKSMKESVGIKSKKKENSTFNISSQIENNLNRPSNKLNKPKKRTGTKNDILSLKTKNTRKKFHGSVDFTENELLNIVFLENKYGCNWKMFLKNYPQYFNDKTPGIFHQKFKNLKKKSKIYKDLKKQAQYCIKDETQLLK